MSEEQRDSSGSGKGKRFAPKVVPLPQQKVVLPNHLANLHASGLAQQTIELAELYTEINPRAIGALLHRSTYPRQCGNALVFPFYLPGADEPYAYRIRPTHPRVRGTKSDGRPDKAKYDQSTQLRIITYYTPRARAGGWYRDAARTLYWTEGEKKALVFDQLELPCVGLTGVDSWTDEDKQEGTRLDPVIRDHVTIAGRHHVICFDNDALDNEQIGQAAARLAGVLLAAHALSVRFVHPPRGSLKGIDDFYAGRGEEETRRLLAEPWAIEPKDPKDPLEQLIKHKALSNAPIDPDLRLPEGYLVARDGALWKTATDQKKGNARVSRSAILINRYLDDLYADEPRVEIVFRRKEVWRKRIVDQAAISDRSTMVAEFTRIGAPVTSNNATALVDWFEALEHTNEGRFERATCIDRGGWHTVAGVRVFVLGEPIVAEGAELAEPLAVDDRGDRRKIFSGLRTKRGTLEAHAAALKRAWLESPIAAAAICAAFAAPLLEPLDAPNFALHLTGDSSRGKTSILKIASSVFGDPNNGAWVGSWNTTYTAAELRAKSLSGLPLCFDEVGATDVQQTEKLVYMLINGEGKSRGNKDLHLRETPTWKTVVLSTGEHQLAGEDAATGAQVRVLQFHVSNFGELDAAGVDAVRDAAIENHGHLGRDWICRLLEVDDWDEVLRQHKAGVAAYRERAKNPLQQRQATYFALLALVETMLHDVYGLGDQAGGTIARLVLRAGVRADVESLALRARQRVLDWWHSQPGSFPELGRSASGDESAKSDRGERVVNGYYRELDQRLLFIPSRLREFLATQNMSYPEVTRGWDEMKWLHTQGGRHDGTCVVKINGHGQRLIALSVDEDASRVAAQLDLRGAAVPERQEGHHAPA